MSSDSERYSEAGNSLVKIMEDDDEVNNSKSEVSEIDEEDSAGEEEVNTSGASDRIGERHKEARLKERGARTNAILKQSSSEDQCDASDEENGDEGDIENGDEGDIENGDSGSEYETRQRNQSTNGDDKQSDVGGGLDSSKRRSRKKPAKYLDDDFDEFDSSEDERVNKKSKKSKYDDDDEEYQPAKEELDRYSRRARKQVNFDNSMFFDSDASSGDDYSYRPSHWKSGGKKKRETSPVYSSDSDDLSFKDVRKEEVIEESEEVKLSEADEDFALAWHRFLLFSRFTPSTKELSTDRPHTLLCEQWDAYTADKSQISAFLHVLRDAGKFKKIHLEAQFDVLQKCITRRLPKLDTLLASKKVIGKKVPRRLVKSMCQTALPNHRWRRFHKYCAAIDVNPFLAEPCHVANFIVGLFLAKDRLHADSPTSLYPHSDFYRYNIEEFCEQLGRYMRQVQSPVGGKKKDPVVPQSAKQKMGSGDSLLASPDVAALLDAADQIAQGNFEKGSLAWRLAPPYSYPRYLIDTHSKSFWQHGLVRRIVRDVREGVLDLEPAASQLQVSPDMLHSALGKSKKVGGDLTVQQYMELDFGGEDQFWGERTNVDLVQGAREGKVDLDTVAFSTGVTMREIQERVGPIKKKEEEVVEKKPKASNSSKGPQLTDLQKQILAAEKTESSMSEYEKMRLENMRERQAMLDMLSMEDEKQDLKDSLPKREARKIDYGVREKSSRLKRKADCLAMRGKQAPEEWSGTGRTRHSPLWVGRWWAPGAEVPPPKREEQITNLVDRGQEYSLVTSRLHRFRAELAEKGGEETETGSSSLLWDSPVSKGSQQPTGGSLLTSLQSWRDITCFGDHQGRLGLQLANQNVVFRPHGAKVSRSILLPQSSSLLSSSYDGTVRLTDLVADKVTVEADFGTSQVEWVEVEEGQCWLAGLSGRLVRGDHRQPSVTSSVLTSKDGDLGGTFSLNQKKSLVAFSHGLHTSVFDLRQTSKALHSLASGALSCSPSWSPSGQLLLSSGSALQVWDLTKAEEAVLTWPPEDQIQDPRTQKGYFLQSATTTGQARYLGARAASWSVSLKHIHDIIHLISSKLGRCPWDGKELLLTTCSVMRSVGNTGDCVVIVDPHTASVLAEVGEESPQPDLFAVANSEKPSVVLGNSGASGLLSSFTFPAL